MDDIRDLKALQLDALREVENIGAGHAATALSQMTNRRIMISVPQITVARLEDVAEPARGAHGRGGRHAAAHARRPHRPHAAAASRRLPARRLCDLLLRRPTGHDDVEFGTLEQSSLKEAGNILCGAYMNALSYVHGDDAAAVGAEPGDRPVGGGAHLDVSQFRARARLRVLRRDRSSSSRQKRGCRGHFLLMPDLASLRAIFEAVRLDLTP